MDAVNSGVEHDKALPDLDSLGIELLKQLALAQQTEIDNLNLLVLKLKRMHFGQRSEKMNADIAQLELWLEDLEANQAAVEALPEQAAARAGHHLRSTGPEALTLSGEEVPDVLRP